VDDLEQNRSLIDFTNHLKKGGLYIIGGVLVGSVERRGSDVQEVSRRGWDVIRREKVKGFYELMMGTDVRSGAANLMLTSGLGGMRPNTVILGFYRHGRPRDEEHQSVSVEPLNPGYELSIQEYVAIMLDSIAFEKNVLIARNFDYYDPNTIVQRSKEKDPMPIDVWHIGACTGGGTDAAYKLCLQLGYVLWRADFFHKYSSLRFFALTPTSNEVTNFEAQLQTILFDSRIPDPVVSVVTLRTPQTDIIHLPVPKRLALINATINFYSSQSAVVFVPISRPPAQQNLQADYINELDLLSAKLPPTMLVYGQKVVITNEL